MYFWRIDKLRSELATGSLREGDSMRYLIGYTMFVGIANLAPYEKSNLYDTLSAAISTIVSIVIIYVAYRRNGGSKGRDFLDRFVSMGFVVLVRALVIVGIPGLFVVGLAAVLLSRSMAFREFEPISQAVGLLFTVVYAAMVIREFGRLVKSERA